ncbi:hypothetical protein WOLCODRAFT_144214 [Wolfiporia cocos MD-104 SS10]|uniref:Transmembrane protein n=1 Tax=Wolfiporia cocos (strain MD-104) TaxID=742152 RepID=A0A2H3JY55_WOLCO|nr:hypothetical protein WOLCODRAFT_144214 [Wolfiporia cocos MD-104 SS10]
MAVLIAGNNAEVPIASIALQGIIYGFSVFWQSWWIIAFPCVAWLGGLGSMMYILNMFASGVISGQRGLLIYAANLTATVALAYRIWQADRDATTAHVRRSSLRPVLMVIIESGAIYTAILILALITTMHALQAEYVVNSIIPAVISITFNMVFIRIGLTRQRRLSSGSSSSFPVSSVMFRPGSLQATRKPSHAEISVVDRTFLRSAGSDVAE